MSRRKWAKMTYAERAAEEAARAAAERGVTTTMGPIRGHGVTRLLVYCDSLWCKHSATLNADWLTRSC